MPNIAELKKIIKATPFNQAIAISGIHGIGKSEIIKQLAAEEEATLVLLYGGETSDAGDIIGLPDRTILKMSITENGITTIRDVKVTEFCPPKWWPFDHSKKYYIFIDEYKRSKPEIRQCLMNLTLNHKMNGYELPPKSRIFLADNPTARKTADDSLDEDYGYDVDEPDFAQASRYNTYELIPDLDEWMDYAVKIHHHNSVIAFIAKNPQYLDPPSPKEMKTGKVYPNRRSWERISDIMVANKDIECDENLFKTMVMGIVGVAAAAKFCTFLRDMRKDMSAGQILTCEVSKWKATEARIKELSVPECMHMNRQMAMWFEGNTKLMETGGKKEISQYTYNLEKYLKAIAPENMAEFIDLLTEAYNKQKPWPKKVLEMNPGIANMFTERIYGKKEYKEDKEEKSPEEM